MFALSNAQVKIDNANPRAELHGEDHKLAVDLKLSVTLSNDVLSEFDPALKNALYWKGDDTQGDLIDDPGHLTALRFPEMGPVRWSKDLAGYRMQVHLGFSGSIDIVIADCAIDRFVFTAEEGGSVGISFRVQCHPDATTLGQLCEHIQQEVEMTLTPPEARVGEGEEQEQDELVGVE